jgi:hypothetical protein
MFKVEVYLLPEIGLDISVLSAVTKDKINFDFRHTPLIVHPATILRIAITKVKKDGEMPDKEFFMLCARSVAEGMDREGEYTASDFIGFCENVLDLYCDNKGDRNSTPDDEGQSS